MPDKVKYALWYIAAYACGVVILGFTAGYLYDQPHPPAYLDYFFLDHPTLTFFLSLILCPAVAVVTVGLVILVIMAAVAAA